MEVVSLIVLQLEELGCSSALVGAVWQNADSGEWVGMAKAIDWALYMSQSE